MKKGVSLLIFCVTVAVVFVFLFVSATVYTGDGNYTLEEGDSVNASNGLTVHVRDYYYSAEAGKESWVNLLVGENEYTHIAESVQVGDMSTSTFYHVNITITKHIDSSGVVNIMIKSHPLEKKTINFVAGWNMFSTPIGEFAFKPGTAPPIVKSTCPEINVDALGNRWQYDAMTTKQYMQRPIMVALSGYTPAYWIKVANPCSITFYGPKLKFGHLGYDYFYLYSGWNQIGVGSEQKTWVDIAGNCNKSSGPWKWDAVNKKYERVEIMMPGEGYWIKVEENCMVGVVPEVPGIPA